MSQDTISTLLGRPLSALETANFKTYLRLAESKVSDILCSEICAEADTKQFTPRKGYSTLNVPIFTEIDSVKLDGTLTEKYTTFQGSKMNGTWFNSIVFDRVPYCKVIEIAADWGFRNTPLDVQRMVAEQFALASSTSPEEGLITSKSVEDFRVVFNDNTKQDAFALKNAATIAKYSCCMHGNLQHGDIQYHNVRHGASRGHLLYL